MVGLMEFEEWWFGKLDAVGMAAQKVLHARPSQLSHGCLWVATVCALLGAWLPDGDWARLWAASFFWAGGHFLLGMARARFRAAEDAGFPPFPRIPRLHLFLLAMCTLLALLALTQPLAIGMWVALYLQDISLFFTRGPPEDYGIQMPEPQAAGAS